MKIPTPTTLEENDDHEPNEPSRQQLIERARDLYQNDDCEIDDNAKLSRNEEGGSWVQGWVYVHYNEVEGFEDYDEESV